MLCSGSRNILDRRIRVRTSEEDVAQSMFKSFCLRQQRGEFDLTGRDDLWRMLVTITLRKVRNAAKANRREKRDVRRERTLGDDDTGSGLWFFEQLEAADPSPAIAVVLNEALDADSSHFIRPSCAGSHSRDWRGIPTPKLPLGWIARSEPSSAGLREFASCGRPAMTGGRKGDLPAATSLTFIGRDTEAELSDVDLAEKGRLEFAGIDREGQWRPGRPVQQRLHLLNRPHNCQELLSALRFGGPIGDSSSSSSFRPISASLSSSFLSK